MREWESEFTWTAFPKQVDWSIRGIRSGKGGADAIEIVWGVGGSHSVSDLRAVWSARSNNGRRNNPVVAIHLATESGPASLVGPGREGVLPPVISVNDIDRLTRLIESSLSRPNRFRAREHLERYLPSVDDPAWGVRNRGLFATHSLLNTPDYHDGWGDLAEVGRPMLQIRGGELAQRLGFRITPGGGGRYSILSVEGEATALGLFLPADEGPRTHVARFGDSPVLYGFRMADEHDLPWIIVNAGDRLQLYSTRPNVGVGRRGRTETYTEVLLDLLAPQDAGYVPLLFSSEALRAGGYLEDLIRRSAERVTDLGTRLRDRVYNDVLPRLATGIAIARGLENPTVEELRTTQGMALSTLFRMLFISYAEDRDLLPYTESAEYQSVSLKRLALDWSADEPEFDESSTALWDRLAQITRAVHDGSDALQIPAYGGTPFSSDQEVSLLGHLLEEVQLTDTTFGPALRALITDVSSEEGLGPIDFRELSVREFGTIYEGLLESELAHANTDLATDRKGFYRPANEGDEVVVQAGEFYLSNGGQRKASASYYTKEFAVEHLLERSLEPALDDHLGRIDALETDQEKSEAFFDFMIADISMGSGHFLVAAVDRIERRFSSYLDENPLEGVRTELNRLWNLAAEALGKSVDETGINQPMLLRRQIARRCIYGVDLNPTAVELARVSIWIHTFVPGLPLSFLDWHLRQGNSIVGVATQDEAWDLLTRNRQATLFAAVEFNARERMQEIMDMMMQISRSSDSTTQEVEEARAAHRQAFEQLLPWEALMDVIAASRLDTEYGSQLQQILDRWGAEPTFLVDSPHHRRALKLLEGLSTFHHQAMFPEVLWRENPGFDVIVGNPPWEKLHVEAHSWWSIHSPGLSRGGISKSERELQIEMLANSRPDLVAQLEFERDSNDRIRGYLKNTGIPGLGRSHIDLYQVFSWKFWELIRQGGRIGVVIPRGVFNGRAMEPWRSTIIEQGYVENLQFLTNNSKWVFEDVHASYSIALAVISKGHHGYSHFCGPHTSLEAFLSNRESLARISDCDLNEWSEGYSFPYLPNRESGELMRSFNRSTKFGNINPTLFRFLQGDMNATADRDQFSLEQVSDMDIPILKGSSIAMWDWNASQPYGWGDRERLLKFLLNKGVSAANRSGSAFENLEITGVSNHPISSPRLAFKDVTSPTNTRSAIFCMIPEFTSTVHTTPLLIRQPDADEVDEAIHLGILNSRIFDWYVRRYVELHLTFDLLNRIPFPSYDRESMVCRILIESIKELHKEDCALEGWYGALSTTPSGFDIPEGAGELAALIDALSANLYGLSSDEIQVIMITFHRNWDCSDHLRLVLEYYAKIEEEVN